MKNPPFHGQPMLKTLLIPQRFSLRKRAHGLRGVVRPPPPLVPTLADAAQCNRWAGSAARWNGRGEEGREGSREEGLGVSGWGPPHLRVAEGEGQGARRCGPSQPGSSPRSCGGRGSRALQAPLDQAQGTRRRMNHLPIRGEKCGPPAGGMADFVVWKEEGHSNEGGRRGQLVAHERQETMMGHVHRSRTRHHLPPRGPSQHAACDCRLTPHARCHRRHSLSTSAPSLGHYGAISTPASAEPLVPAAFSRTQPDGRRAVPEICPERPAAAAARLQ